MRSRPVAHEHGMVAVHAAECIGIESLFRTAMRNKDTIETSYLVHVLRHRSDVVRNHDQGQAQLLLQAMKHSVEVFRRCHIDSRCRLIEEQELGLGGQSSGQERSMALTSRQLSDGSFRQIFDPHSSHGLDNRIVIPFCRTPQQSQAGIAAHHHQISHVNREIPVHRLHLWNVADSRSFASQLPGWLAKDINLSRYGTHLSQQGAQQGGFARSVGPEYGQELSRKEAEGDFFQDNPVGQDDGDVIQLDNGMDPDIL